MIGARKSAAKTNMMKTFLLLILSLMTGCKASPEVNVCREGWVEFIFKYPKKNGNYQNINVVFPSKTSKQSTQRDVWETKDRVSLYHDTKNENLRVSIKHLQSEDFGKYKCIFYRGSKPSNEDTRKVKLEDEEVGCQKPLIQTAYRTAKTSITCNYPNKDGSNVYFFCKENGFFCEDILSTKSSLTSNGTFTLKHTNSGFNMSISNVSSQHAGVYWCGVQSKTGSDRAALKQIQLHVEASITNFIRSPTIGQNLTYWCQYPQDVHVEKFICKGQDPSTCQTVGSTRPNKNTGKFSMKDDKVKRNITITVREVAAEDSGTYWCGAESTATHRYPFFHRLLMTVVPPTVSTTSILSSTSHYPVITTASVSTPASAESHGPVIIAAVVSVAVLVLVFILVLVYKQVQRLKKTSNGEAQNNKEDRTYEEMQEHPQKPDSGTAPTTIYVTANFPTNFSAFNHNFAVSGKVSEDPYSTITDDAQCPTYSTVNHPSRVSEDPFFTVN